MATRTPRDEFRLTRKLVDASGGRNDDRDRTYEVVLNGEPVGTVSEYSTKRSGRHCRYATIPSRTELVSLDWHKLSRLTGATVRNLEREIGSVFYHPTGPRLTAALAKAIKGAE